MYGKKVCNFLRSIRKKIADDNQIPLNTEDCTYEGECSGTCPRCEGELRYLEQQLEDRRSLGNQVTVTPITVGAAVPAGSTAPAENASEPRAPGPFPPSPIVPGVVLAPEFIVSDSPEPIMEGRVMLPEFMDSDIPEPPSPIDPGVLPESMDSSDLAPPLYPQSHPVQTIDLSQYDCWKEEKND